MGQSQMLLVLLTLLLGTSDWVSSSSSSLSAAAQAVDCSTVATLVASCSSFVTRGSPDPMPGSPCCEGIGSLNVVADTSDNKQSVCSCLMGLISTYDTNATAVATLPGLCGVDLGFIIAPNTDCTYIP